MKHSPLAVGDWVIYAKTKHSARPGPRARDIEPAPFGEEYTYQVDKFWIVVDVRANDLVVLATRRGKIHEVSVQDPNLRRARWWERLLYRGQFPATSPATVSNLQHG